MNIVFLINEFATEDPKYTTPLLGYTAHNRGNKVYFSEVSNLEYLEDGGFGIKAKSVPKGKHKDSREFFEAIRDSEENSCTITHKDIDVLFLRNNPSEDVIKRPWAVGTPVLFGKLAVENGIIVVNDPGTLEDAMNKMYFQYYPKIVRIPTIITRSAESVKEFYNTHGKNIVLKPLQGSGGQGVFFINEDNYRNLNQTIEALNRDGFIIVQKFIKKASESDIRLFMINGEPLQIDGKYAAVKRISAKDDIRSNLHAGGSIDFAEITPQILKTVEIIKPKLKHDGIFMAGLDITGNKLIEVNVFSPGGLHTMNKMYKKDFTVPVIEALEKKILYKQHYGSSISNRRLAIM